MFATETLVEGDDTNNGPDEGPSKKKRDKKVASFQSCYLSGMIMHKTLPTD